VTEYVVGFAFAHDHGSVLLIRKNRPEWQLGRLNGVGGKIEAGEGPQWAMAREIREETGLEIGFWQEFVILNGAETRVHFFRAFDDAIGTARRLTPEQPIICHPGALPADVVPGLTWLIPLALDPGLVVPIEIFDKDIIGGVAQRRPSAGAMI